MTQHLVQSIESLGHWLIEQNYRFITPTPLTHHRVIARSPHQLGTTLRDIFGWSLPFDRRELDQRAIGFLESANLLEITNDRARSLVRFSSIGQRLYAHSAFPTTDASSIFFGPDTYRFVNLISSEILLEPLNQNSRILDVCCGAGPGGIEAANVDLNADRNAGSNPSEGKNLSVTFADINPLAISFAEANARINGLEPVCFAHGDLFDAVEGNFDLIVANPPYLVDNLNRVYRNGGGQLGAALSEKIVAQGVSRLAPGGRLMVYTGVAIAGGVDQFLENTSTALGHIGLPFRYWELDPDVFGEELDTPAYGHVDRIAAVALVVKNVALSH